MNEFSLPIAIALIVASYLIGSFNFAIIVSRVLKKTDIRKVDHAGASGVFRQYGTTLGILVLLADTLKGVCVGLLCILLPAPLVPAWVEMVCGLAVVAGHNWPVYFGFAGGGGLTTIFGFLIVVLPLDTAIFTTATLLLSILFWKTPLGKHVRVLGRPVPAAAVFGVIAFFIYLTIRYGFLWNGLMLLLIGMEMAARRSTVLFGDKYKKPNR